ncbi:MAG TPA: mechanosensitive ion channel protein [Planctomycetaceae bacterium]|nr:mechanosensitive ion channel protein [Planctomycetaceae bacterium]HRF01043.1 mechanosensitive ion channel [Pirellulaceae bacterium]
MVQVDTPTPVPPAADTPVPPPTGAPPSAGPVDPESLINEKAGTLARDVGRAAEGLIEGDLSPVRALLAEYAIPAIAALLVLIVGYFAANFLSRIISTPIRKRVDETLGRFAARLVFYGVMIGTILGVLGMFGIDVASFAAVIAAAGFAIGLAFQGTLSNFASGVLLLVFRPFKVGDMVSAAGVMGKVHEIDLFVTTFDTPDNRRIIVPNSSVTGGTIENVTHHVHRRVEVAVGVRYDASLDATRAALTEAAESMMPKMIRGEGRGYQVVLVQLGASSVDWMVRLWTHRDDFFAVKDGLTAAVKNHLDEAGIGIPFPQLDVHIDGKLG